jgi:HEPN domain-containing protein
MGANFDAPIAWLTIASKDLASAKKLATPPDPEWEAAVYHCQQAAEKSMKSLLVAHGEMPPKWHDVGLLLGRFGRYSDELRDMELAAERLTVFATKYRYPDFGSEPLSQQVVDQAISDASLFLSRAEALIELQMNADLPPKDAPG